MQQIAATRRLVCTAAATSRLRLVHRCYISHKFKPVWICATDRSDKILSQWQWFSHVTRGDLLQQPVAATCRSDLSHRLSRPLVLITFLWLLISWEYFNRSVVIWYIPRYTGGVLPAQKSWVGVCSRLPKTPNPFMTKIWNLIYDHCSWAEKLYPLRLHIPI